MTALPTVREPSASARPLAEGVIVAATTTFLFVSAFAASAGLRATCLLAATIALAWSLASRQRKLPTLPLDVVIALAAWAFLAVASLAWSVRPDYTLGELRPELFYSLLAFGVFFLASGELADWKRAWAALAVGSLLLVVFQVLHEDFNLRLWRHEPGGGPGPFSTHLVMMAALLPALIWPAPWGFGRAPWALALALAVIFGAAWTTGNRIVWIALIAACVAAILASTRLANGESRAHRRLGYLLAIGALVMATAFVLSIGEKSERFYRHDPTFTASLERDVRRPIWTLGLKKAGEAPWLGHGFGREILEPTFLPLKPDPQHPPVTHGHNAFLNVMIELGAAGLAIFVALWIFLARHYWRMLGDRALAPLGVIGITLLTGFLVKSLTDDFFHRHNGLVFWALNGMLLGLASRQRERA